MSTRKILAFTGIRSDYDLMSGIYKKIVGSKDLDIALVVSGAHLSETYGNTVVEIEKDNIPILARVENLLDSNSRSSRVKSLSILLQNCIHTIESFSPDLIIFAGDREEVIVGAMIGSYLNIPTVHFFGGDHAVDGHVDNSIRHATSKLSTFHFVTNEKSKKRLIRIGESADRIFNVGSPSLDKYFQVESIEKNKLIASLTNKKILNYSLVIFHPFFGEEEFSGEYFEQILISLKKMNIKAFISYPNVDSGSKDIINIINKYHSDPDFVFYKNLERNQFINLFRHADFLIGNSSAGIYETPLLKKAAINVGKRQKGRLTAENVIFINQSQNEIIRAINTVQSRLFQEKLKKINSPYGDGDSVDKVISTLKSLDLEKHLYKTEDPLELKK